MPLRAEDGVQDDRTGLGPRVVRRLSARPRAPDGPAALWAVVDLPHRVPAATSKAARVRVRNAQAGLSGVTAGAPSAPLAMRPRPAALPSPHRPLSETVEESPEHPSGTGERCGGGRGHGVLSGYGLVVVGARDHIDDLLVVEVLGAGNGRNETDQHSIAHDLSFQA